MILYTMQPIGRDITQYDEPTGEYKDGGAYHEIAEYLGRDHWLWCFTNLEDFDNEWMVFRYDEYQLWTLDIPDHEIKWCALNRYCEHTMPVEEWFGIDEEILRECGDIPQALIPFPIDASQVIKLQPGNVLRDYLERERAA